MPWTSGFRATMCSTSTKRSQITHCVVIKYVPYVGDSKCALDEYTSELLLDRTNTLVLHDICEGSFLAVPIMLN